ncbi:heat shock protein, putative, partial [Entamoeba invadens IP1]|uniref:heat shock protein, putative n=1 Tax=Entamoeba invadens IP1 TaxID=370355 RepID=UPI0002C3E0F3
LFGRCQKLIKQAIAVVGSRSSIDKVLMVGGSCKCPAVKKLLVDYFGMSKVDTQNVDYELIVCRGCTECANAVESGLFSLAGDELLAKNIGLEMKDPLTNKMKIFNMLKAGSPIPCKYKETFVTTSDYQTTLLLQIYEDQKKLNDFKVTHLPTMLAGYVEVEVVFSIESDGRLMVRAKVAKPRQSTTEANVSCPVEHKSITDDELKKKGKILLDIFNGKI